MSSLTQPKLFGESELFIPVLSINDAEHISEEIYKLAKSGKSNNCVGFGLRIVLDNFTSPDLRSSILRKITQSGLESRLVDLILDLEAPSCFLPNDAFANSINSIINEISNDFNFRNVILISTSIPESYSSPVGELSLYPRYDWQLYRTMSQNHSNQCLIFGDYTIVHLGWNAERDMRTVSPSAKVVYAVNNEWLMVKGTAFASDRPQMHALCFQIVSSSYFMGDSFSEGSRYIQGVRRSASKQVLQPVGSA